MFLRVSAFTLPHPQLSQPLSRKHIGFGWGGMSRTFVYEGQSLVPYHLATPQYGCSERTRTANLHGYEPGMLPLHHAAIKDFSSSRYIIAQIKLYETILFASYSGFLYEVRQDFYNLIDSLLYSNLGVADVSTDFPIRLAVYVAVKDYRPIKRL